MRFIFRMDDGCGLYIVWKSVLLYSVHTSCALPLNTFVYLNMVTGTVGERDSNELNMAESLNKRKSNHPGFQGRAFELKKKIWAVFQYCWLILFTGLPTKYVVILTFSALVTVKMFLSFPNHLINNITLNLENKIHPSSSYIFRVPGFHVL